MEVQQQFSRTASAVSASRALIEPFRDAVDRRTFHDLCLLVSELTANCIQQGGDGPVTIAAQLTNGRVHVEVDCPTRQAGVQGHPQLGARVLGLRVINQLASAWGVDNHEQHSVVWADLTAARSKPQAPAN